MVTFDQLRISDDGRKIYIDAHVNMADYFKDYYIKSISIVTAEKVTETAVSPPRKENCVYYKELDDCQKELHLVLESTDLSKPWNSKPGYSAHGVNPTKFPVGEVSTTLFFVYIQGYYDGAPDECLPCSLDKEYTIGVTFDENLLYQRVMGYTKDLVRDCCTMPVGFMDFILLWNAFKASVETEHWIAAIKFYNMLFDLKGDGGQQITVKSCGCNG